MKTSTKVTLVLTGAAVVFGANACKQDPKDPTCNCDPKFHYDADCTCDAAGTDNCKCENKDSRKGIPTVLFSPAENVYNKATISGEGFATVAEFTTARNAFAARFATAYANVTLDARKEDYKTHITTAVNIILVNGTTDFEKYDVDGVNKKIKINVDNMGKLTDTNIDGWVGGLKGGGSITVKAAPVVPRYNRALWMRDSRIANRMSRGQRLG